MKRLGNMKNKIINKLIKRCNSKLTEAISNNDKKAVKLYTTIHAMLYTENPFDNLYVSVAINVLTDLGYSLNYAKTLYKQLIK